MTATDGTPVLDTVLAKLDHGRCTDAGYPARCPAHEDRHASLSVSEGVNGRVLVHCHAGCDTDAIVSALGMTMADLFPPCDIKRRNGSRITDTYSYVDENGALVFQVVRMDPKGFRQRCPDGKGGWTWKLGDARRVLYRLPQVIAAAADGGTIFVVEGEKDVHALEAVGKVATTNPGGAGKWRRDHTDVFRGTGANVLVWADGDPPGLLHARTVTAELVAAGVDATAFVSPNHKDASAHLGAGLDWVEIVELDDAEPSANSQPTEHERTTWAPVDGNVNGTPNPATFFDSDGLDVHAIVTYVDSRGPIATAIDGRLWAYRREGVWTPDGAAGLGRRVRDALGRRYRPAHLTNVISWYSQSEPTITAEPVSQYINVPNGLLNWRTLELHAHTPDVPSTVQIPVRWHPDAVCPTIDRFLAAAAPDDAQHFMHELFGYLILPGNPLHRVPLLLGPGSTGKGTFVRLTTALVGQVNTANVTPHQMSESRFATASLFGKLLNVAGDLDSSLIEHTDNFKMVTGGDTISAEHKYGHAFSFTPWATHIFSANEPPVSRDTTSGWYRRWLPVPFTKVVEASARLPEATLDAALHHPRELEGLLVHAVTGLRRLMDHGRFTEPDSVTHATGKFRSDTDTVAAFIGECLVIDPACWLPRKHVYDRYLAWCNDAGRKPFSASRFYERLNAAGASDAKREGQRGLRCGKSEQW